VDENWYDHYTGCKVTNDLHSVRTQTLFDELTVVLLVKRSTPIVKTKVLSVPAEEASIPPSHCHFVPQCCVTLSVNMHVTHLICRVTISKIYIALVIITITILITTPTNTNWWSCPTHSALLAPTNTQHLQVLTDEAVQLTALFSHPPIHTTCQPLTLPAVLHPFHGVILLYDVVTWRSITECTAPVIRQTLVHSRCVSLTQLPVTVCCVLLCI